MFFEQTACTLVAGGELGAGFAGAMGVVAFVDVVHCSAHGYWRGGDRGEDVSRWVRDEGVTYKAGIWFGWMRERCMRGGLG